jgi:hypothetical protein
LTPGKTGNTLTPLKAAEARRNRACAVANLAVKCLHFTADISTTIFKSKLRPCDFDLAATAKAWFRLVARNASHFGVTSCHAIPFPDRNVYNFYLEME